MPPFQEALIMCMDVIYVPRQHLEFMNQFRVHVSYVITVLALPSNQVVNGVVECSKLPR